MAQCPAPPATCTYTVTTGSNENGNFTVGANQALCIQSGTFTGNINNVSSSGVVYVAPGAVFNPASLRFGGRVIICGTATIPGFNFDDVAGLARIENYGVSTFTGTYGFNQRNTWINGLNSEMIFNNNITMNNVNFTNNGNVLMKGSFTMNTGSNVFVNHDSLTALGPINLNASINNDGYLFAKGSEMILNASGNITNSCYFVADGGFTYNGLDTLFVTGFTWVTGLNGSNFVVQGKALSVTGEGFVQGVNFGNNGTPVIGNGKFVFSGNTINQGPFGNDAQGLNFYDSSVPGGGRIFDLQNTLPHGSVTRNVTATRDGSFVPNTCSDLIKCNTNTGDAGNDTTVCGSSADLRNANPNAPHYQRWGVVAGNPSAATIDPVTGTITGMNVAGVYQFKLYKYTNASCEDIIRITVTVPPLNNLTVSGGTICRTATNATVTVNNAQAGVTYEAYLGTTLLGSAVGANANLNITIPVASLVDGSNTITFQAKRNSCATVNLTNSTVVVVSPAQNANATVTATSPICAGGTSTITIAATNGITYTVRDQNNNIVGTATATSTGPLTITTTTLSAATGPVSYTFTITATVTSCAPVELTAKPVVVVNPAQNPSASVTATSPLCSGATSTVTIAATNGVTYTVRDQNNVVLGTQTATSTGNITINTSALTATGSTATYTLTVTATVAGCNSVALATRPTVTVNPLLTPSVTLSSSATTICAGTSVTVTATPTNGGTSPTYQWRINGVNSGAVTASNTFTSSSLANGDVVSVVMTSNATCATPTTANSTSNISMVVNPLLAPSVTLASSATTICAGTSVTVTATPVNGGANPSYQWRVNGANSGAPTSSNTFTSSTLANGDVVSVILTSNATCATPTTANSTSNITMTVNPNITPTVSITSPATTICSGSSITFTATPVNGGTTPGYQWRVNGANVSGATNSTYTTNTLVNGDQVSVVLTSNAICRTSNTATSNVITMNIGTNLIPSVNISTPQTTICAGTSTTFTASVANGGAGPTFQWQINGVNAGAATNSATFTRSNLVNGDQVSVILTSNETCVLTNTANSNVISMTVNPIQPPSATVTATSPVCSGGTSVISIAAIGGMTYTVRDQDNNILGTSTAAANGNLNITTGVLTAVSGPTIYTFTITASIAGCNDVVLTARPSVTVNPSQNANVTVTATSPICSGGTASIVSVFATNGITYTVRDQNNNVLGTGTASSNGNLNITTTPLIATTGPTSYTFTITASVAGCNDVILVNKPTVLVNPAQNLSATVTATSPVCSGGTSVVTIAATNGIRYTVTDQNNNVLGAATATSTGPLNITTSALIATTGPTIYTFTVTASVSGCNSVVLTAKPSVTVNPVQDPSATVTATSPICSGGQSVVTVEATSGMTYTITDQNNNVLGSGTASGNGNLNITTTALTATSGPTVYTFTVTASIAGCSNVVLTSKPSVTVNPVQNPAAVVTATSPICSGNSSVVTIAATHGITYTIRDQNNNILGTQTATSNGNINITTTALSATTGPVSYTFTVTASVPGCNNVVLTARPVVLVNKIPSALITATGSTICTNTSNATVNLTGVEPGVSYQAYLGTTTASPLGNPIVGPASQLVLPNTAPLVAGPNIISIRANIAGCTTVLITDTARVVINILPTSRTFTATSPICEGTSTSVSLTNPQSGVRYTVVDAYNATLTNLSPILSPAGLGSYALPGVGLHTLSVKADILGCATVNFPEKVEVQVNTGVREVVVADIPNGPICQSDNNVTITISDPEVSVEYNVFNVVGAVETLLNTTPLTISDPSYTIANIPVGTNDYIIKATIGGCGTATVSTFSITVDETIDLSTPKINAGIHEICEQNANAVDITISGTQAGVTYQLKDNNTNIGTAQTALSDNDVLTFGPFSLSVGMHVFTATGGNTGCGISTIISSDTVNVNKLIDSSGPVLKADTNVICETNTVSLALSNTQGEVVYTLFIDGQEREQKQALSDNEVLTYGPYTLSEGIHVFTLNARNNACSDTVLSTQSVKVNRQPDATLFNVLLNKSVLCSNDILTVQVAISRNQDYSYQVVDFYNGVNSDLGAPKLGVSDTLGFGPFSNLGEGEHLIKVIERVQGCSADTSAGENLKINNSLDTLTPVLIADSKTICEDGAVSISISKTAKGDVYQLFINGKDTLAPQTAAENGDTLTFGPIDNLRAGTYFFSATTTNAGCGTFGLAAKDTVKVNKKPSENTSVVNNSPICVGSSAVVTVAPVDEVSYSLYQKSDSALVAGPASSVLTTPVYTTPGIDSLYVVARILGCSDVTVLPTQYITINTFPTELLSASDATICSGDSATVTLSGPTSNFRYSATANSGTTLTKVGPGELNYRFSPTDFIPGSNTIRYSVDVPGCGQRNVLSSLVYMIKDTTIESSSVICEGYTETYTVPTVAGVTDYTWVIPVGAQLISQNGNSAVVKWGGVASSGDIKVYPNSDQGTCPAFENIIKVQVYETLKGDASFFQKDTLCVGTIDTLGIENLLGVLNDTLYLANGVEVLDTLPGAYRKYIVRYNTAGSYVHTYKVTSPCGKDSIYVSSTVTVLAYPIAIAGSYPIIDMRHYPREVVLDGSASSKGNFIYKWETLPKGNIASSNSIISSLVPEQTVTKVKFTVTTPNGMCAASDTTSIIVDLGIFIPNVFTPNGDGDHDDWVLENVNAFYPNVKIDIFSKWGTLVYHSDSYVQPWNGTRNNEELPAATYYYVIDLKKPGFKPIAGSVTIIR